MGEMRQAQRRRGLDTCVQFLTETPKQHFGVHKTIDYQAFLAQKINQSG